MASASQRVRPDSEVDHWSDETPAEVELRPVDLDQKNDRLPNKRPSLGRRSSRAVVRYLITFGVGVAATLAWQSYGDAARRMIAGSYPQLGWLAPRTAVAQTAPAAVMPAPPATPSADLQQFKAMLLDLAAVRQSVDQLAAQVAAGHQQIAGDIATLQTAQQAILRKISAPAPRPAAIPARNAVQLTPSVSPDAPPVR
jgi:hypothetical protein